MNMLIIMVGGMGCRITLTPCTSINSAHFCGKNYSHLLTIFKANREVVDTQKTSL